MLSLGFRLRDQKSGHTIGIKSALYLNTLKKVFEINYICLKKIVPLPTMSWLPEQKEDVSRIRDKQESEESSLHVTKNIPARSRTSPE